MTTGDNVERVLQVGVERQKWGWQLDYMSDFVHHICDTGSLSIVMFDLSGSSTLDSFKFRDI